MPVPRRTTMTHHRTSPALSFRIAFPSTFLWRTLVASCAISACTLCALPASAQPSPRPSPAVAKNSAPSPPPRASLSLADKPPTAATVTLHNGKLAIHARNSTLLQIFQAINAQTGMKIQGYPGDHRVFGDYGPGQPRSVLSELLSGFNFNYLLLGSAPNGMPDKLILAGTTGSMPGPAQPVQSIQPAPQDTLPQPDSGPRPAYQPRRTPVQTAPGAPRTVPTPQQLLRQMEAMRAQRQSPSH